MTLWSTGPARARKICLVISLRIWSWAASKEKIGSAPWRWWEKRICTCDREISKTNSELSPGVEVRSHGWNSGCQSNQESMDVRIPNYDSNSLLPGSSWYRCTQVPPCSPPVSCYSGRMLWNDSRSIRGSMLCCSCLRLKIGVGHQSRLKNIDVLCGKQRTVALQEFTRIKYDN